MVDTSVEDHDPTIPTTPYRLGLQSREIMVWTGVGPCGMTDCFSDGDFFAAFFNFDRRVGPDHLDNERLCCFGAPSAVLAALFRRPSNNQLLLLPLSLQSSQRVLRRTVLRLIASTWVTSSWPSSTSTSIDTPDQTILITRNSVGLLPRNGSGRHTRPQPPSDTQRNYCCHRCYSRLKECCVGPRYD